MKLSSVLKVPAIAGLVLAAGISLSPSLQAETLTKEQIQIVEECTQKLEDMQAILKKFVKAAQDWKKASEAVDDGKSGDKTDDDEAKKVAVQYKALETLLTKYKAGCKLFDDIAKESQK